MERKSKNSSKHFTPFTSLYVEVKKDPRPDLYQEVINLWSLGKSEGFVTEHEAKQIVGITERGNKSTASRFKPGTTYFVPSLKIHKLARKRLNLVVTFLYD